MNATIHEIVSALTPDTLAGCIHDISELSQPTREQRDFLGACKFALAAIVGDEQVEEMVEVLA